MEDDFFTSAGALLELLMHANQLKRTTRTGWAARGVPNPENAAAHSFGVAFTTLVLAQEMDKAVDLARAQAIAVLHDLPEALTSDIPVPSWTYLPEGAQELAETAAINEILGSSGSITNIKQLWDEWQQGQSLEAKLVKDADRLDRYLQAYIYELHTGNRQLSEFWESEPQFNFTQSDLIYRQIRSLRAEL